MEEEGGVEALQGVPTTQVVGRESQPGGDPDRLGMDAETWGKKGC